MQQREFAGAQIEPARSARGPARQQVDAQIAHRQLRRLALAAAAGQHVQAREQFEKGERLGKVVVGAGVESVETVVQVVARRQHDDRRLVLAPQRLEHRHAIQVRQHDVQHDGVVGLRAGQVQAVEAVGGGVHHVAVLGQAPFQVVDGLDLVFDQQELHGCARSPVCRFRNIGQTSSAYLTALSVSRQPCDLARSLCWRGARMTRACHRRGRGLISHDAQPVKPLRHCSGAGGCIASGQRQGMRPQPLAAPVPIHASLPRT